MKKGWERRKLGEVLAKTETIDPTRSPNAEFDYIDVSSVSNETLTVQETQRLKGKDAPSRARRLVRANDVLFATIRPTLRRIAIVPKALDKQVCSTGYFVLRAKPEVDFRFIYYFLQSETFMAAMEKLQKGASYPAVTDGDVRSQPIPVPPLAEQRRIVEVLDAAFAGLARVRAAAATNLQNARALFASHLHAVFSQPALSKAEGRGEGWVEKRLGEVGKVAMCKRIFKEETTAAGDIPFYKIGTFGREPDAFIPIQTYNEYRAKYSFPKQGDVLISASGTIGRRVRYDGEPAYFQDSNIVWIDNDEKQVLNDYLYHFYGACEWSSTKGATISRLYNDNLRQIAIACPESHQEQRRIVTQLDALAAATQRLAALYERKLAALAALRQALLHQAFAGEL